MIYLASPYSDPDPIVREYRYRETLDFTIGAIASGHLIFSPIVYGHQMSESFGTDYEVWAPFNDQVIQRSSAVWVLTLPGWEASRGIRHELSLAKSLGLPIEYFEWTPRHAYN